MLQLRHGSCRGLVRVSNILSCHNMKGGESMDTYLLSLLSDVIKIIVKVTVKTLAKYAVSRKKERTTPISSRDGSDSK